MSDPHEPIEYSRGAYRGRRGRMSVRVRADGSVVASAPARVSDAALDRFVHEQRAWIERSIERAAASRAKRMPLGSGTDAEYRSLKETARDLVAARLAHFNQAYGFRWKRIAIRRNRSRWGSCSADGNLNFDYRLALLPPDLADYVVVHELCHIDAFDHSAHFWALVARACPDYRAKRAALRRYGLSIG